MRKALLTFAALTGFAVSANAAKLQVNNQSFADFGLKLQIYGQYLNHAAKNGAKDAVDFTIQNARIYFIGQLNPIVKFGANLDFTVTGGNTSHEATSTTKVRDAYIDFAFNPLFNVMAGYTRVPFSREDLVDRYDRIFMPQDGWVGNAYKNQLIPTLDNGIKLTGSEIFAGPTLGKALAMAITDEADASRDAGVTIWGSYGKGLVTYYVGVYDSIGDHNVNEALGSSGKDNLGFVARVQFSPVMLGYQGEGENYYLKETYLGQKKVATVGLAFATSKLDLGSAGSYNMNSWTIDVNYEAALPQMPQIVPKFEAAYVYNKCDNLPLSLGGTGFTLDKTKAWYVKVGALYNQKIWLGKVGAYVRYQDYKIQTSIGDIKPNVWTVTVPYYIDGQNAKVVLQWDHYNYDKDMFNPRNSNKKTNDDVTLAFQIQF